MSFEELISQLEAAIAADGQQLALLQLKQAESPAMILVELIEERVEHRVGAVEVASGRQVIGSSLSREVRAEKAGGWGKAAHAPSELDEDTI